MIGFSDKNLFLATPLQQQDGRALASSEAASTIACAYAGSRRKLAEAASASTLRSCRRSKCPLCISARGSSGN